MSTFHAATSRVLGSLAELLHKPLHLVDAQSPEASNTFAIRIGETRAAVVSSDGTPFGEHEQRLIQDILEILRKADETEARFEELETRMLSLQRENLDLVVKNRLLSEVSSRDTLTGLYNRWYVIEKIDSEINRALRHGSPMSLLMLDIDHFKRINDTFGHPAGDQVLQGIGKVLKDSCRVYDVPGRYGGEEFCIVLPETKTENTTVVAERIRRRLASTTLPCADEEVAVTVSIGIAGVNAPDGDEILSPGALIDRADRALYSAKTRGRNRVEMWNEAFLEMENAVGH